MRFFIAVCPQAAVVDLDELLLSSKDHYRVHINKNGRDYHYAIGVFDKDEDDHELMFFGLPAGKIVLISEIKYLKLREWIQTL